MSDVRRCPECAEEVQANAKRCPHCRSDLTKTEFQRKMEKLGGDLQGCGCAMLAVGAFVMVAVFIFVSG